MTVIILMQKHEPTGQLGDRSRHSSLGMKQSPANGA